MLSRVAKFLFMKIDSTRAVELEEKGILLARSVESTSKKKLLSGRKPTSTLYLY